MTATIDGVPWVAATTGGVLKAYLASVTDGRYSISGTDHLTGGPSTTVGLILGPIDSAGTYPLGVDGFSIAGGSGSVTDGTGTSTWSTPLNGASGSVTVDSITPTRIAGTFTYTSTPLTGAAQGNRVVTAGDFDLPISGGTGNLPMTPDSLGGSLTAALGGVPWSAGITNSSRSANTGLLLINGINTASYFQVALTLPPGPGTYPLDDAPGHQLSVYAGSGPGAVCCWGVSGDTGTMQLTSLTATRARGTLSATLSPRPNTSASGTLTITNGSFDVGLFHTP